MKRSIGYWSTALAAAALIALPASGFAQPPASPPAQQPTTQTPTTSQTTTAQSPTSDTATSPADHVREAKQALSSIPQTSIPARDRAEFAQLRTHLDNLERDVANGASSASATASSRSRGTRASASAQNWASEVSKADTILTKLIGADDTRGNTAAGEATGTAGSETPKPTAGTAARRTGAAASSLDESTKDKLREVRRHVTELASAMSNPSGASNAARTDMTGASAAASADTMGSAGSSSQSATPTSGSTSSTEPSAAASAQTGTAAAATQQPAAPQADAAAAKQHLSEARDSLSQLTALPEASKLQGDARTQVSQLISNFNELITTQSNWREAYSKVEANLNALIGADAAAPSTSAMGTTGTTGSSAAGTTGSTTGTTGAVTAAAGGSVQLDPAIRTKLVEFRMHLKAFEQAAGGSASQSASTAKPSVNTSPSANPATPMSATGSTSTTMPPSAATASSTSPANPASTMASSQGSTPAPTTPPATATSGVVGTSGSTASAPTPTDTPSQGAKASEQAGHMQADKELDAIQAILDKAKNGKLDKSDTDQLKTHVAQLRQLLAQSGGGQ